MATLTFKDKFKQWEKWTADLSLDNIKNDFIDLKIDDAERQIKIRLHESELRLLGLRRTDATIAEIRNLFNPILNFFTIRDEKRIESNKKKIKALEKAEVQETEFLEKTKPYDQIKELLDKL